MIHFKRGIDPKEAMTIGNEANPIQVADLYAADDSIPEEYRLSEDSANITGTAAHSIFQSIEAGQVRDWENRFLVGVETGEKEPMTNGGIFSKFTLEKMGDYKGYWIEYRGRRYQIPILVSE